MSLAPFSPDTAFAVAAQRLGLDSLPLDIRDTEYHYALLRLATYDARFEDPDSLSWSDRLAVSQFLGCAIAARALAAERSGLSSVVTQVRSAEGSGVTFAASAPDAPEALMADALESLALVSFVRADRVASATSFSLCQINGRSRQREAVFGRLCGGLADFGLLLFDFTLGPFGGGYGLELAGLV